MKTTLPTHAQAIEIKALFVSRMTLCWGLSVPNTPNTALAPNFLLDLEHCVTVGPFCWMTQIQAQGGTSAAARFRPAHAFPRFMRCFCGAAKADETWQLHQSMLVSTYKSVWRSAISCCSCAHSPFIDKGVSFEGDELPRLTACCCCLCCHCRCWYSDRGRRH